MKALQPSFGVLFTTPTHFFFFKERPGYWMETIEADKDWNQFIKVTSGEMIKFAEKTEKESEAILMKVDQMYSKAENNYVKINMNQIESMRIITTKVPAIELAYTNDRGQSTIIVFSLLSDYQVQ